MRGATLISSPSSAVPAILSKVLNKHRKPSSIDNEATVTLRAHPEKEHELLDTVHKLLFIHEAQMSASQQADVNALIAQHSQKLASVRTRGDQELKEQRARNKKEEEEATIAKQQMAVALEREQRLMAEVG